ncbi:MAG: response regulator [Acidobacteria bacterium]|nr:response regulator [Acidobacteriota bacterium]
MVDTVLVVEDDPANAVLIEAILRDVGGFEVVVTEEGNRVLELVGGGGVAAAVMDISLGRTRVGGEKVDGIELTRRIRQLDGGEGFPVVLLSAHAMRGDAPRFLFASGANDYVTKPILDPEDFVRRIRRQIAAARGIEAGTEG